MKFKDLRYNPDEEVFLFYTKEHVQSASMIVIGRELKPRELKYLREKTLIEIRNLMVKIESSGIGNGGLQNCRCHLVLHRGLNEKES